MKMTTIELIKIAIERGNTYDPETGIVYSPNGHIYNNVNIYNRLSVYLNKKRYQIRCHQFAFYYVYGYLPEMIDHIDQNKLNNKICNLRPANSFINVNNATRKIATKKRSKWTTSIRINGKKIHLGTFNTEKEAQEAYYSHKSNKIDKI